MRLEKHYFLILIPNLVSFDCLSPGGKEADEGRLAGGRLDDAAAQATWAPGMRDFTFRCEACQLPYSFAHYVASLLMSSLSGPCSMVLLPRCSTSSTTAPIIFSTT